MQWKSSRSIPTPTQLMMVRPVTIMTSFDDQYYLHSVEDGPEEPTVVHAEGDPPVSPEYCNDGEKQKNDPPKSANNPKKDIQKNLGRQ